MASKGRERSSVKSIRMFILRGCPYCRSALQWQDEWIRLNPAYQRIPLEIIDESEEYALAKAHDYYLVPTWYVEGVKVHEGAATREIVRQVLEKALEE